jgi:uncharacterized membrane protein
MTTQHQTSINKTALIDAPLEKVFAYYADPSNNPEIWPSLVEVKDVVLDEKGYPKTFRWTYKMAGMHFESSSEYLEYLPIDFTAVDGKTQITEQMDYSIPIPLLGKVAEKFLIKLNENEMTTILNNLKARMESEGE